MPDPQVFIVLDSSAIKADGYLSRATVLRLNAFSHQTGARVLVPEVVRREVQDLLADEVREATTNVHKANQGFRRAGADVNVDVPLDAEVARGAQQAFLERLRQVNPIDLPHPTVSHADVLDRVQSSRRPFRLTDDGRDRGYKDFLLWRSVLDRLRSHPPGDAGAELILVTANRRDFCADKSWEPHPDLLADLEGLNVTLAVCPLITDLVKGRLSIAITESATLAAVLQDPAVLAKFDLFVAGEADNWFVGRTPNRIDNVPYGLSDVAIEEVTYINLIQIMEPWNIEVQSFLAEAEIELEVTLHGEFPYRDVYYDDDDPVTWQVFERSFSKTCSGYAVVELEIEKIDHEDPDKIELKPTSGYVETLTVRIR